MQVGPLACQFHLEIVTGFYFFMYELFGFVQICFFVAYKTPAQFIFHALNTFSVMFGPPTKEGAVFSLAVNQRSGRRQSFEKPPDIQITKGQ